MWTAKKGFKNPQSREKNATVKEERVEQGHANPTRAFQAPGSRKSPLRGGVKRRRARGQREGTKKNTPYKGNGGGHSPAWGPSGPLRENFTWPHAKRAKNSRTVHSQKRSEEGAERTLRARNHGPYHTQGN